MFPDAHDRVDDDVSHELQLAQIEIGTPVCRSLDDVRAELVRLRGEVGAAAADRGLAIVAAGSHPLPSVAGSDITDEPDYQLIAEQYAHLAREQVIFGCHVHVGIADRELAVAAMNHARPWLSVLLALSASSPFWDGLDTGLRQLPQRGVRPLADGRPAGAVRLAGRVRRGRAPAPRRPAASTTRPGSTGTPGRRPATRRSRCGSPTCARRSTTPC